MTGLIVLCVILPRFLCAGAIGDDRSDFFERNVRPLLVKKCGDCHGGQEPEGNLTLTTVAGISKGGSQGALLVPGKPNQSRLLQAVRYTSMLKMPPDSKLSVNEIAVLEQWVRDGAVLPGATVVARQSDAAGRFHITDEDRYWWSFQPVGRFVPPRVRNEHRVRMPMDRFILRKLEEHGLMLSPDTDRRTFIRRLTFDLIGLPPAPAEVDAFVTDDGADAFEKLVDRLLASPHYGERWGRHWLDLVRYADTNGGGFDYVYPNAWRYRDYVVRAFNQDKPYDRFLTEQLAGDLLAVDCDQDGYIDWLTATGLLTLAPKGLGMQDKERMILDVVDDQIDVLGRSLMGLTLSCARCHDHKFDPISTRDYYGLAGIFHSSTMMIDTDRNPSYWPERPLELPSVTKARKEYQARTVANAKAIAELKDQAKAALISRVRERLADYLFAAARIRRSTDSEFAVAHWSFDGSDFRVVRATIGPDGVLSNIGDASGPRPTRVNGRPGRALRFIGQRDVVAFDTRGFKTATDKSPDKSMLAPNPWRAFDFGRFTDFSIAFWMRSANGYSPKTADTILSAEYASALWFIAFRPGAYNGIYLRHYDGKRTVDIKSSSNQLTLLCDNQWHHVAFTADRDGSGSIFIDGEKAGETSIAAVSQMARFNDVQVFSIGASLNSFRGDLDDVAIWNRMLSPAEIQTLFSEATDSVRARNVAQVESERAENSETSERRSHKFSYEQAAQQGLVPSHVRQFVEVLAKAEGNPDSPFVALNDGTVSIEKVQQWLANNREFITPLFDDAMSGPLIPDDDAMPFYGDSVREHLAELMEEARAIERTRVPDPAMGMVAFDTSQPGDLAVLIAGDHRNPGDLVPRGFPQIVDEVCGSLGQHSLRPPKTQSGRLELARWLTSPDHPLTGRVFVNHVWKWHFGEGLVRTPDNFGRQGEPPSHPQLLDWLAQRFMDGGWSVKDLHRQIVLSSTYRQMISRKTRKGEQGNGNTLGSSFVSADRRIKRHPIDSANRLLWRMNRQRLESESLRDAMLAASGQLDRRTGGSVNMWKPKTFSVDDQNAETSNYDTRRRSVYLPVVRGAALHEMMQLFDFGDPNSITARRDVTTVGPQALFLMNNPFVIEQAGKLAERLITHSELDNSGRIQLAYQLTVSREPTAGEQRRAVEFLAQSPTNGWQTFCQMLLCLNEFAYLE